MARQFSNLVVRRRYPRQRMEAAGFCQSIVILAQQFRTKQEQPSSPIGDALQIGPIVEHCRIAVLQLAQCLAANPPREQLGSGRL